MQSTEKLSLPLTATSLQSGPIRREIALLAESIADFPSGGDYALVRNAITLIDSGHDLERVERSAHEAVWLKLGRLAIGQVVRAGQTGPAVGEWIYWNGPHADYAPLSLRTGLWAPVPGPDPLLLPAGIGVEAQFGIQGAFEALESCTAASVVLGQGMLGHLAAQWLKAAGSSVSVVDNSPKRLEFSRKSGLRRKVDTHNTDWMDQLRAWHPDGVPLLVDATGAPPAIESLLPVLQPGGTLCLLGQWRSRPLPPTVGEHLDRLSASIVGPAPAFGAAAEHAAMLRDWLGRIDRGEIPTERLLTHHVTPAEAPVAIKRFAAGIRSWQGAVIHWNPASFEKYGAAG